MNDLKNGEHKKMILLTAFKDTSSEKLIKRFSDFDRLILENHKEKSSEQLAGLLDKKAYGLILSFGQRPLIKDKIHFESIARDKNGGGYITDFDIENALKICKDIGISAKRSDNAGTSYCNNIYYWGLNYIKSHYLNTKMCFVHIPFDKNIGDFVIFSEKIERLINKLKENIMSKIKIDTDNLDKYFEKSDLIPAIAFDVNTKTVLMLAYMNRESLKKTLETGYTWYWSRSRQELWNKGSTSGHLQKVISVYGDCDNDTLLLNVEQTGAACHTGNYSCFFNEMYNLND